MKPLVLCVRWLCIAAIGLPLALVSGAVASDQPWKPSRLLLSGHSLVDDPFGGYLQMLAESRRAKYEWEQQIVIGSPIQWRTEGDRNKGIPWAGYTYGKNRDRTELDLLAEFKRAAEGGSPYDTLLIMERHHTVGTLRWHDVPKFVRHFHERLIEHNPNARTYFLHPWESIKDKSRPDPWLAIERDAAVIWQCVGERINLSLDAEGRSDRVRSIPLGLALAELVDAMRRGELPGVGKGSLEQRISTIIKDDVHLTALGQYYTAVVTDMVLRGETSEKLWQPFAFAKPVTGQLKDFAARFYRDHLKSQKSVSLKQCRDLMANRFCDAWNAYVPSQWTDPVTECREFFQQPAVSNGQLTGNPFAFSKKDDDRYWLPAP